MVPARVSLLCSIALFSHSIASSQQVLPVDQPVRFARLDLATGTVTMEPSVHSRAGSTIADFSNMDGAAIGLEFGGGSCEWIDGALKGTGAAQPGNASDLMTGFTFAYSTAIVNSTTTIGFYEGYTVGGPAPSTAVALFNLALPGHSANGSFGGGGGVTSYFLNVNLPNCIAFADGAIGYSWRFTDLGTTNVYAGTAPFLACVQSCSGPGPDGQGMVDLMDQYCPPGGPVNTFSFGSAFGFVTSIMMQIEEVADAEATAVSFNSQGINTDVLASNAVAIGSIWQIDITLGHGHGASGATNVKVRSTCINGPNLSSPTGHPVEVLTSGPLALTLFDAHDGTSTSYNAFPVPCDLSLVGLPWAAQGTVVGGGRADLSTARCGTVGSIDLISDP
jgi:hypothetical protein